jgi:RNA polymerase sigma-70 factor (ECF subfamily)
LTAIEEVFRSDWGRLLSALIHLLGDFDVAEEALQEAFAVAVTEWADGAPRNPSAWLYGTARHKAIDRLRRQSLFAANNSSWQRSRRRRQKWTSRRSTRCLTNVCA